jgi:hypothetical protein
MALTNPITLLDQRYSDPDATPESWVTARQLIEAAPIFWLSTVTSGEQPHVTPLIAVWHDEALWFCTGLAEQKAKNLAANAACTMTTGSNSYEAGLDVVVRSVAERVTNDDELRAVAARYLDKYGEDWRFDVVNGNFQQGGHDAAVFRVAPQVAHGFRRGPIASQTRWTF